MADYVVTLTGKDNLSKTVQSVKKELDGVGSSAQKLDKISAQFDKITKTTMPLNKRVKETSKLLSQMNFDGDVNAAQFLKMAKEAGKAKDAISDTQQVIKAFADDNFVLNAVVQGVQGIAAAGSVATGTMALFGVESETAAEAIRKVQGALAILNGLQTIANVLNKDSYVSIARKIISLKAEAVATDKATAAQTRLNLAVLANPYVAAAAAIAALAAAIYVYTRNSDDATKAQEELQKSAENFKQSQDRENATLAESVTKFKSLQTQWNSLAGDLNGKKKFIVENKTEFENLGIKVNNVTDAEAVFGRNANAIIAAMRARARAAAAYATMVDNLKDQYAKLGEVERKIKNGESFTESDLKDIGILNPDAMAGLREDLTLKSFFGGEKSYTVFGKNAADLIMDAATVRAEQRADELNKTLEKEAEKALKIANETPFYSTSGKGGNKVTKPTKSPKQTQNTVDYEKDSLEDLQKQREKLNKELQKKNLTDEQIRQKQIEIEDIDTRIAEKEARINAYVKEQLELRKKLAKVSSSATLGKSPASDIANQVEQNTVMPYVNAAKKIYSLFSPVLERIKSNFADQQAKDAEKVKKNWMNAADALGSFGEAMSTLGQVAEDEGVQVAGIVAQAIANIALGYAQATAQAGKLGPWGWAAFAAAGLAQMLAMVSQIKSVTGGYADGGIIGGTSYKGDKLLARVNSGEMVLNKRQQSNLFNAISSGNIGGGTVSTLEFKLRGADIYGSMKNYTAIKGKTGLKGI